MLTYLRAPVRSWGVGEQKKAGSRIKSGKTISG
jgi:hypothetical protein